MARWSDLLRWPSVRTFGRSFKDHTLLAVPLILVASVIQILSILGHNHLDGGSLPSTMWLSIFGHRQAIAFLLGGIFFGTIAYALAAKGWRENTDHLWQPFKDLTFTFLTLIVLSLMIGVWILSERYSSSHGNGTGGGLLSLIEKDPGGIFVVFMGVLTVVGFAVTLQSLWEIRSTIKSFPDLNDRLCKMFDTTKDGETVHMVCYTPSLGFIALEKNEFNRFFDRINGTKAGKARVEMICLRKPDLNEWHELFIGRKTGRGEGKVSPELAEKATEKAEITVGHLLLENSFSGTDSEKKETRSPVKRLPFDFMPGYYFFYNGQRAIIVAPLNLPFPKGAPNLNQIGQRPSGPTVHMIGFETSDQGIIHDLSELYDSYRSLPSFFLAEREVELNISDFENWGDNKCDKVSAVGRKLLEQVKAAKNESQVDQSGEENKERARAYGDSMSRDNISLKVMFRVIVKEDGTKKVKEKAPDHG